MHENVRLAASVMLARPSREDGIELYMTRRSASSAFAPDAFVFPGGTVDDQDWTDRAKARTLGLEPDRIEREFRARVPLELPAGEAYAGRDAAGALMVAALRELFEEAGVAIACSGGNLQRIDAARVRSRGVAADRARIRGGEITFADFLNAHDLYADARELAYFSHWVTPASEPRRYNTHFFFAAAPLDQGALADAFETHDGIWIAPARALARHRAGNFHLVYPTIKHLERLAPFASVDAALAFARSKPILTIVPTGTHDDGFEMPAALEAAW